MFFVLFIEKIDLLALLALGHRTHLSTNQERTERVHIGAVTEMLCPDLTTPVNGRMFFFCSIMHRAWLAMLLDIVNKEFD